VKEWNEEQAGVIGKGVRWIGGIFSIVFGIAFAAMPAQEIWSLLRQRAEGQEQGGGGLAIVAFLSIFVLAGLGVIIHGLRLLAGKGRMANPIKFAGGKSFRSPTMPIRGNSASSGRMVGVLFGLVFFLVGCGMFYGLTIRPLMKIQRAKSWQPVPAVVTRSQVESHSSSDGTTYSIDIAYRYTADGRELRGDRYSFFGGSSSGYDRKKAVVDRYPTGHAFEVFVDPEDSSKSVIVREMTSQGWIMIFPVPFMAAGLLVLCVSWRQGRPGASRTAFRSRGGRSAWEPSVQRGGQEPLVLKPLHKRWAMVAGLLFFALFWNGIVSVFVVEMVDGWRSGHGEIGLTLFMIPFVLVGLAVIVAWVRSVLMLANPRVVIALNRSEVVLGVPVSGRIQIEGASHRLRTLTISLIGREEASYQRGTTTHTDKHVFYEEVLLEKDLLGGARASEVNITVPGQSMHSFSGQHNKVIWLLRVDGEIRWWPDVKDEYPVDVLPIAGRAL
jgi:hypothetical protein